MVIEAPGAKQIAERSEGVKDSMMSTVLSRSL